MRRDHLFQRFSKSAAMPKPLASVIRFEHLGNEQRSFHRIQELPVISKIVSHHKMLEELVQDGMGTVYKAQDTQLDRIVTVKFLPKNLLWDEEAKTRFVQEADAASALDHPNINRHL